MLVWRNARIFFVCCKLHTRFKAKNHENDVSHVLCTRLTLFLVCGFTLKKSVHNSQQKHDVISGFFGKQFLVENKCMRRTYKKRKKKRYACYAFLWYMCLHHCFWYASYGNNNCTQFTVRKKTPLAFFPVCHLDQYKISCNEQRAVRLNGSHMF